jgi:beta-lactamase class A
VISHYSCSGLKRARQGIAAAALATIALLFQDVAAAENPVLQAAQRAEATLQARVGVAVHDTQSGESWRYRADERFPLVSTFKVLACAALLHRADAGKLELDRPVNISADDLVTYSPVTEAWVGRSVSLADLCDATMRHSDNTAANKVLEALGGPHAVTEFVRSLGDTVTRLDRWETDLNTAMPGDPRDTSSPDAMVAALRSLLLGNVLSPASTETLIQWMVGNEVGGPLLRAGLPNDWRVGDRTGAGGNGTRAVVAVVWPPQRAPLIAAIYITETDADMKQRNQAIAGIGRALVSAVDAQ